MHLRSLFKHIKNTDSILLIDKICYIINIVEKGAGCSDCLYSKFLIQRFYTKLIKNMTGKTAAYLIVFLPCAFIAIFK